MESRIPDIVLHANGSISLSQHIRLALALSPGDAVSWGYDETGPVLFVAARSFLAGRRRGRVYQSKTPYNHLRCNHVRLVRALLPKGLKRVGFPAGPRRSYKGHVAVDIITRLPLGALPASQ